MICSVVGARPNFMKMAPVVLEIRRRGLPQLFVHTGQHYDESMSGVFLSELGLPQPDVSMGVGSGSHAEQTARVMTSFEAICLEHGPRLVLVAGDVNSTLACALAAAKLRIPVAHIEAGLRSFDRSMPEEINRLVTDHLSELLFTTEPSGAQNLEREGISGERVHFVGNTMIDSLNAHLPHALERRPWRQYGLEPGAYGVVTLHRPSNVDDEAVARALAAALKELATTLPLLFPMHPRTKAKFGGLWLSIPGLLVVEPLGYLDFIGIMASAKVVLTDSGGIQEETTALGVPCVTIRHNTERPITLTSGTNHLVPPTASMIVAAARDMDAGEHRVPPLWDGHAAPRIVDVIERWMR
ncbi:MAG: UDP-N-acetylglucosamine 2-epimerase (non-hydrolyzing) [Chloroflexia bacterium]